MLFEYSVVDYRLLKAINVNLCSDPLYLKRIKTFTNRV